MTTTQNTENSRSALVTGASSGIGQATVRALRAQGWKVFAVARRAERLNALAAECGAIALAADVSVQSEVDALVLSLAEQGGADTLVNCAGGARGSDYWAEAKDEDWEFMWQSNVMGTMRLTRALLPSLRTTGGTILNVTSTAALASYEGGSGYNAAKAAQRAMSQALRLEEVENGIRVIEILPGLVQTEEFALRRLGSKEAAENVYAGVAEPLTAEDVAEVIRYAVSAPAHVNLDEIVIRPQAQAANHKLIRKG
ncbi:oxidoreductase [Arthrobacter sp. MYb211]|uniref:SDR family oxidoreductase n=1 Tax=Micrococcaceae TaxID=1268 RepID=UPI000CFB814E|nr:MULTISPECIES: SDR family oxidoreductase [unclassified Arthrobacter]PRA01289.1 oxidoreductase [Arthrobacter sp. MYb224]PRA12549.1 oxidoreductase [Arthrobacter sp. MYb221]PRC09931.1 oxidoreductase [Arthrobacter sp. MYb211]